MPELPEVQGLVDFLTERTVGRKVAAVHVLGIQTLKTFSPAPDALAGGTVAEVARRGKWLDLRVEDLPDGDLHLVFHLARAGWLRWHEKLPGGVSRSPKSPVALRVDLDDGSGFSLTEAGTRKRLAVYVVASPEEVPAIASLGIEPLSAEFTRDAFAAILAGRKQQIKGVLREQGTIAGIGNAYSDDILHAARMSPFAISSSLDDEAVTRLYNAIGEVLRPAIEASSGRPAAELKDAKRSGMRVHGRAGQECGVCGDVIREVSFADSALQYCATCQTGGKILADRRMSKLLR
ncbi:Fpg/Nei family DNA glycosylase [Occultella aeris]|uniref:Putative formamidopyrimidine-DNA glycosylase-like protein n=1 Tax=Occultella aeris TaxID=2761496 RepID=A0A7M4DP98_9MICO|nr:DNA-formamidopyrimidine glycosylase family protein [Occultella aeris]VZO39284.1 putative formamidopyrimidine-DNA glycosylase-like protein [Occultella aeris]